MLTKYRFWHLEEFNNKIQNRSKVALFKHGCGKIRASYVSYLDCRCWGSAQTDIPNLDWGPAVPSFQITSGFVTQEITIWTILTLRRIHQLHAKSFQSGPV
jgi:hypothetical protein